MGTEKLLMMLLPLIPDVLEFLTVNLNRIQFGQSVSTTVPTDDQRIFKTVRDIVTAIDAAHDGWSNEDKRVAAASSIRAHLQNVHGIVITDSEINLLIELQVVRNHSQRPAKEVTL